MKKTISLILCLVFCFACFAPSALAADKVLKVATNVAWPPYEYYEDEKAVGIDVDIIQAICDKLGYKMELIDMEFGSIITAVATGKVDVGFGAITITEERAKSVLFTTPYDSGIQAIIVKEDSKIATVEDLGGKGVVIGVQQDTTGDLLATEDFGDDHMARFNKAADAVQALITGKVSAVIIDNIPAETFVSQNKGLKVLPTSYYQEDYGFEINKDNEEFYKEFNAALEALIEDGTVQAIKDKYNNVETE